MVLPLYVAREPSMAAVEEAMSGERLVFLVAQRDGEVEHPSPEELHLVGTVATIMRVLRMPDGRAKVLVQGLCKGAVESFVHGNAAVWARVDPIPEDEEPDWCVESEALTRTVRGRVEELLPLKNLPPEILSVTANVDEPGRLADLIASHRAAPDRRRPRRSWRPSDPHRPVTPARRTSYAASST